MAEQQEKGAAGSLKDTLISSPAADRLKEAATAYAGAQAQRLLTSTGRRLGEATNKLNDVAEGGSSGLTDLVKQGGKKFAEGKGPLRSALEIGASSAKDKAKEALGLGGGRKGGGGSRKFVTISEQTDIGVPVREAYDQWTQYQEFSTFTKGVQGVEVADDTTSNWRAKIFWSTRSWQARTTEQIPDKRIAWTSEGAKGTTRGVVTFHALAEDLTRVLLVIEYTPKGLFEKTGNIWRAQGRRARLDLKHFRRFVMMRGSATDGWRGEIRDGEVVRTHEEVVDEEESDRDGAPDTGDTASDDARPAGEDSEEEAGPRDAEAEDGAEDDEPYEDEAAEDDEEADDDGAEAYEDEDSGAPEDDVDDEAEDGTGPGDDAEDDEPYEDEDVEDAEPEDAEPEDAEPEDAEADEADEERAGREPVAERA